MALGYIFMRCCTTTGTPLPVGLLPCRSRDPHQSARQLTAHANNVISSSVGAYANSATLRTVPPALVPCCRADLQRKIQLALNSGSWCPRWPGAMRMDGAPFSRRGALPLLEGPKKRVGVLVAKKIRSFVQFK